MCLGPVYRAAFGLVPGGGVYFLAARLFPVLMGKFTLINKLPCRGKDLFWLDLSADSGQKR